MTKYKLFLPYFKPLLMLMLVCGLIHCSSSDPISTEESTSVSSVNDYQYDPSETLDPKKEEMSKKRPRQASDCLDNQISIPNGYVAIACVDKNGMHYPYGNLPYESIDSSATHITLAQNKYEETFILEEYIPDYFPDYLLSGWEFTKHFDSYEQEINWVDFRVSGTPFWPVDYLNWSINGPSLARFSYVQEGTGVAWIAIAGIYEDANGEIYHDNHFEDAFADNAIFLYLQKTCSQEDLDLLFAQLDTANNDLNTITIEIYNAYLYDQPNLSQEDFYQLVQTLTAQRDSILDVILDLKDQISACDVSLGSS